MCIRDSLYRLKSCVDTFSYQFKETDPETGKETVTMFSVTEKRIVSYNPSLAKKQTAEILKMADKASNYTTYKAMTREELGDCAKYIKVTNKDKNGKKIKPVIEIDQEKLEEDLKYAGYNLIVTSELDMDPVSYTHLDVYKRQVPLPGSQPWPEALRPPCFPRPQTGSG